MRQIIDADARVKAVLMLKQEQELNRVEFPLDYGYADTISGAAHAAQREQFSKLLDKLRKGDILVVSKLDRLGRDAVDVLATIRRLGELQVEVIVLQLGKLNLTAPSWADAADDAGSGERDLLLERTKAGLARARAEGRTLGRPRKTTEKARMAIVTAYRSGTTISALARAYGVSRATVSSVLKQEGAA